MLNYQLFSLGNLPIDVQDILRTILIIFISYLLNSFQKNVFNRLISSEKIDNSIGKKTKKSLSYFIWTLSILTVLLSIGINPKLLKTIALYKINISESISINLFIIFFAILLIFANKLFIVLLRKHFERLWKSGQVEISIGSTILQIVKYISWVVVIISCLELIGLSITILLAGSAALLVGFGLALQQIFNDIISGIILLFERTLKVGDVVEVGDSVGKVNSIGLRTSEIITKRNIRMLIRNSQFVNGQVTNWSHEDKGTWFSVKVGVAYGTDANHVEKILVNCALSNKNVNSTDNIPFVLFSDFGDSALTFNLFYWTIVPFENLVISSDIRYKINTEFINHKIQIPFPQQDIYIKEMPI